MFKCRLYLVVFSKLLTGLRSLEPELDELVILQVCTSDVDVIRILDPHHSLCGSGSRE